MTILLKIWLALFSVLATLTYADKINHGRQLLQAFYWTQVGADIDGEAASDDSGWSVSMSSDGTHHHCRLVGIAPPQKNIFSVFLATLSL